jgi:hypothetical protein
VVERKVTEEDFQSFAPGSNLRKEDVTILSTATSVMSAATGDVQSTSAITSFALYKNVPAAEPASSFDELSEATYNSTLETFTVNARADLRVIIPAVARIPVSTIELMSREGSSTPVIRLTETIVREVATATAAGRASSGEGVVMRRSIAPVEMISQPLVRRITPESILRREIARFKLNVAPLDDVLTEIAENPRDLAISSKLIRYATLLPEVAAPEIIQFLKIRSAGLSHSALTTVMSALATAGTEAAQSALIDFAVDADSTATNRIDALHSLVFIKAPSTASVQRVNAACLNTDYSISYRDACVLVLGAMLEKTADASLVSSIATRVMQDLAAAGAGSSRSEIVHLLHVLGNMGERVPVAGVMSFITNSAAEIRAAAVDALRGVGAQTLVRDALAQLAANETNTATLIAIVNTQEEAISASRARHESDEAFGAHVLDYVLLHRFGTEDISDEARMSIATYLRSKKSPQGSLARRGSDWSKANPIYDLIASQESRQADKTNYPNHKAYIYGKRLGTKKINLQVCNSGPAALPEFVSKRDLTDSFAQSPSTFPLFRLLLVFSVAWARLDAAAGNSRSLESSLPRPRLSGRARPLRRLTRTHGPRRALARPRFTPRSLARPW